MFTVFLFLNILMLSKVVSSRIEGEIYFVKENCYDVTRFTKKYNVAQLEKITTNTMYLSIARTITIEYYDMHTAPQGSKII